MKKALNPNIMKSISSNPKVIKILLLPLPDVELPPLFYRFKPPSYPIPPNPTGSFGSENVVAPSFPLKK